MTYFTNIEFFVLAFGALIALAGAHRIFPRKGRSEFALLLINLVFLFLLLRATPSLFLFLLGLGMVSYGIGKGFLLAKKKPVARAIVLALGLAFPLFVLCASRYPSLYRFAWFSWGGERLGDLLRMHMPFAILGLSYLVFKILHFLYECYAGTLEKIQLVRYLNFLFFFPTYLSGPIDRYQRFSEDFSSGRWKEARSENTLMALYRIGLGLFKKNVLVAILSNYAILSISFESYDQMSRLSLWGVIYASTFMLYFDFSGYSDMAIGLGNLFGVRVPENFNRPLLAKSVQDFWNRWHMTLSSWIRDYVFYPLMKKALKIAPNRATPIPMVSILISFVLVGVWHGDTQAFVVFGFLHGTALAAYLFYRSLMKSVAKQQYKKWTQQLWYQALCWGGTFHFVVLGNLLFYVDVKDWVGILLRVAALA